MNLFLKIQLFILLLTQLSFAQWTQSCLYGGPIDYLAVSDDKLFAVSRWYDAKAFLSTNNGTTWSQISLPEGDLVRDAAVIDSFIFTAMGFWEDESYGIYRSADDGKVWSKVNIPLYTAPTLAVYGTNIFVGTEDSVFLSTDYGESWSSKTIAYGNVSITCFAFSDTNIFAGTSDGVYLSTNNGTSWTSTSLTNNHVYSLAASDTIIFAGTRDGVYLSTNNGTSWARTSLTASPVISLAISGTNIFASVWSFPGTNIFASVMSFSDYYYDGVYRSTDSGTSWNKVDSGPISTGVNCFQVYGTNLFAGTQTGVFLSTDSGESWNGVNYGIANVGANCMIDADDILFAGTRLGIYFSTDKGENWKASNNGLANFNVISLAVNQNKIFAGTGNGLYVSTDKGKSWFLENTGLENTRVKCFAAIDNNLYVGTNNGVFRSTDNGTNWINENLPFWDSTSYVYIYCLAVHSTNLFALTSKGVFILTDNGTNWIKASIGSVSEDVDIIATSGSNLYALTNIGIYLSTDNGMNWIKINGDLPGSINSLILSGTDILIGTNDGVYLSPDNGASWISRNDNLVNNNVTNLFISDSILFASTDFDLWKRLWQDALLIEPGQINFGFLHTSQISDTISVAIKNRSSNPITIYSITDTSTAFNLLDLPALPSTLSTDDSIMFKVYFNPLSYGDYYANILIASSHEFKPTSIISLFGNARFLGSQFWNFYNKVNLAVTETQKKAIVDSFMNANPVMPLVEDSIANFIYYGDVYSISVACDANKWGEVIWPMENILGTQLWFRSQVFEMDARIDYRFEIYSNLILDPRNPRVCPNTFGGNSELAMPNYVDAPEIEYYPDIPHGTLIDTTIISISLGNSRTIRIYLPPGYNSQETETYGVVLFHDGLDFINFAKANNVFDYLINKKRIKPLIGIFVPPVERDREYADDKTSLYESFIIDELMPYIDSRYRTKSEANQRAMVGISFGGLINTQICYNNSETFGLAGIYSGSYKANGMQVYNSVLHGPAKDIKWYMDCGTYEPTIARALFELRDSLLDKGYEVNWRQWHEGHSWGSWRAHLDIALEYFFPGDSVTVQVADRQELPLSFSLSQNYPNPFNPTTKIKYTIPNVILSGAKNLVTLKVYDVLGNEIATLVNDYKPAGNYEVEYNASGLSSGVYFYRLQAGTYLETKKMVLLR